ncbi:DUF2155 domain-containing protein [Pseudophaeobacter sp.]|uniref:DUF2155 domain-containing protein n=1 Tax=Pseudophaeobacter sp. TaxID=1971739 RepID=UPI0040588051
MSWLQPLAKGLMGSLVGALGLVLTVGPVASQEEAERGSAAVLRGLDKVDGSNLDVEIQVGGSAEVFGLMVTLSECRYPVANPTGDAFAYLTVRDPQTGELFFEGWMIASSPALSALDHARYDVWVMRCKSI